MKNHISYLVFILNFFLININAQNPTLVWANSFVGGALMNQESSIAVDASGNVYTTGYFQDIVDFDPSPGTYTFTAGWADIFVSKLDANGNFLWARQLGGISDDVGHDIAIDVSGNVYITGHFRNVADFDPGPSTYTLSSIGGVEDIFVVKLNSSGNFVWAKQLGGTGIDDGISITLDASANVYVGGIFNNTADFDPGVGTYTLTSFGSADIFVLKLDVNGNFVWAKQLGGASNEVYSGIAVDGLNNVYSVGNFSSTADFDPGVGTYTLNASGTFYDIFVSKLDPSGNFGWVAQFGSAGYEFSNAIAIDALANVYTTGIFSNTIDFDPTVGTFTLNAAAGLTYISKLDSAGNFIWATQLGGTLSAGTNGRGITVDPFYNVYTTGTFGGVTDFDPGTSTYTLATPNLKPDVFISKLDAGANFVWAVQLGGGDQDFGLDIDLDPSGNVYTTGFFQTTCDFDPDPVFVFNLSAMNSDVFIHKMYQPSSSVGIKEIALSNQNGIYPNPFNDKVTVVSENANQVIQVYNSIGILVYNSKIENKKTEIDLSNRAAGIYFIKIGSETKKIIKE